MSEASYLPVNPPNRVLLGAGPSNVPPRVQQAMAMPVVGHLDPYFTRIMDETMQLLRGTFRTANKLTFPVSGTGSAGMEAAFCNFLEEGDVAVIGTAGLFGDRMVDNAARLGAKVVQVNAEWGKIVEPSAIEAALKANKKVKLVAVVHAETSTGVLQPLAEISKLAIEHDALFLVDTVTSLGGQDVAVDDWGIDICYSGTQKNISCPPGLAPLTANERALATMKTRNKKVVSWYLDLSLLSDYWATGRVYHHTAPISMVYALHEALAIVAEEGLPARIARHARNGKALHAGLEAMGLTLHAQAGHRLSVLTSVRVPAGVDDAKARGALLKDFNIEISGGLGQLKGQIWRIGLMGHSSTEANVLLVLHALEKVLLGQGCRVPEGAGVKAANEVLQAR